VLRRRQLDMAREEEAILDALPIYTRDLDILVDARDMPSAATTSAEHARVALDRCKTTIVRAQGGARASVTAHRPINHDSRCASKPVACSLKPGA
jgi:hypothetical protein